MAVDFLLVHLPPCHLNFFLSKDLYCSFFFFWTDEFFWNQIASVFPKVSISLNQFHVEVLKNVGQRFFSLISPKGVTVVS